LSTTGEILEKINDLLQGKFSELTPISENHDEMDAVIVGLNILGDHLQSTTVSIEEFEKSEAELRKTKDNLSRTVSQLQATLQATADGILVVDKLGNIEIFNDKFVELWRLPDDIVASRDDTQAINFVLSQLSDPQQFLDKIQALYDAPEDTSYDRLEFKDGRVFERYSKARIIEGEITGRVWSFRDITEVETSKKNLIISTSKAEAANLAKTKFLSSISHEFRTPLNAIMGFSKLLEMDSESPLNQEQSDMVDQIGQGGMILLNLINSVLDLSEIETGEITLSIESFDPLLVVRDCLSLVDDMAKRCNIRITQQDTPSYDGRLNPCVIRADRNRFHQVLLNLLTNAIKYNRDGGEVSIRCQHQEDNRICFTISDTGIGIPEDLQDQLFQPFQRLGAENSKIDGTGIGLTLAKILVELMGGEIGFNRRESEGTDFWVSFASDDEDTTIDTLPDEDVDVTPDQKTVLYVEDNPTNLNLMKKVIERINGVQLIWANTAESGIEMALRIRPALILMDINLPGMNGIEALKQIKALEVLKEIPVIAVSANAMQSDIDRAFKVGFKNYITKPFKVAEIIEQISSNLS